jgi:dTDP-4-dehydrorhamnose reductase
VVPSNAGAAGGADVVRILLTGAGGQLGHDVTRAADGLGFQVAAPGRDELDLEARPAELASALQPYAFDALINCAAWTRVDDAEAEPDRAFAMNARAAGALATACAGRGARFVMLSTDYVFDGQQRRPYREDDPTGPLNVYGASKLEGERLALEAHPEGTLVVRTASLFGVEGARRAAAGRGGNFVETIIRNGARTGRLRVVADVVMSPTATADVAPAILALLRDEAPSGTYHIVNEGAASWYELACAIVEAAAVPAEVEPIPAAEYGAPARRPTFSVLDTTRAVGAGYRPRPWRSALEDYLAERAGVPGAVQGGG